MFTLYYSNIALKPFLNYTEQKKAKINVFRMRKPLRQGMSLVPCTNKFVSVCSPQSPHSHINVNRALTEEEIIKKTITTP